MGLFGPPNIAALKSRQDVSGLVKACSHRDSEIRLQAVQALAELGSPAYAVLVPQLLLSFTPEARVGVAGLLRQLGWMPKDDDERTLLCIALEDWPALVQMGPAAVGLLTRALNDKRLSLELRVAVGSVLAAIGGQGAVDALLWAYLYGDPSIAGPVQQLIVSIVGGSCAAGLGLAMKDGRLPQVRRTSASHALSLIGPSGAEALMEVVESGAKETRAFALAALAASADPRSTEVVKKYLPTQPRDVQSVLTLALGDRAHVARSLSSPDPGQSTMAALMLANMRDPSTVAELSRHVSAMGCDHFAIPIALGRIGDEAAVEGLERMLKSPNWDIRLRAVISLTECQQPAALQPLSRATVDRSLAVRAMARIALSRLPGSSRLGG